MKIGKKFLSLLMGVAVLLVSSLPAFAAAAGHRRPATADKTARLFYDRTGRL